MGINPTAIPRQHKSTLGQHTSANEGNVCNHACGCPCLALLHCRGHQLWVEEQLELQRGAELCILSAPCQVVPPILSPPRPSQHHTPSRALPGGRAPHESPTDALLSPQTASVLFAAAMGGTCLSPAITGAAAAQLLSPSAFGFPSLVLQDQTNYHKRAASQPPCVSPPTFTCHVEVRSSA